MATKGVVAVPESTAELTSSFLAAAAPQVRERLQGSVTLEQYLQSPGTLSLADRRTLVEQALVLMEQNYVHLPPKVALYAMNPVQALRLMQIRLDRQTDETMDAELAFNAELSAIFHSVRDLHTNYLLPEPFAGQVAYLPIQLEEYWDDSRRRYVVSHIAQGFSAEGLAKGVEVTHWNGVPIDRAVEVIAARYAGSNAAARHSRGLQSLTIRPLVIQLPPDELWVTMSFTTADGESRELRLEWLVVENLPSFADEAAEPGADGPPADVTLALDIDGYETSRAKAMLFAPECLDADASADPLTSELPRVFRARVVETPSGSFGHLRIFTFNVNDWRPFVAECARLIDLLPQDGLIIDVRDNGGGNLLCSEGTLQLFTPRHITPEPCEFINLPLNLRVCRHRSSLKPWMESLERAREVGATFSEGFPITPETVANGVGQRYHGPVVLITNARCYSATDFFAAGFADHDIGIIIGTDPNTGAGGANVWTHSLLKETLAADPSSPYRDLPGGADMRVAIRRGARVNANSGVQLEDLGVVPDRLHRLTKDDVLHGNADLLTAVGRLLQDLPVRALEASGTISADELELAITASAVERGIVWVGGEPRATVDLTKGSATITLDALDSADHIRIDGYTDGQLVAARLIPVADFEPRAAVA
jgi:hypothetical protein